MSSRILLIATREFRQIAAARSFWFTMLIIPLALAIGPIASHFMEKSRTETVMLIDPSAQIAPAIRHELELDTQRDVLGALARYARLHNLERADPRAPWAQRDHLYSDAEVEAFIASGGGAHAQGLLKRAAGPDVPPFEMPEPDYEIVRPPPALVTSTPARLAAIMPRKSRLRFVGMRDMPRIIDSTSCRISSFSTTLTGEISMPSAKTSVASVPTPAPTSS